MTSFDPLPYAIPGFVTLIVVEMVWARRTGRTRAFELRDTAVSLGLGLGSVVAGLMAAGTIAASLDLVQAASPWRIGWHWWAWIACFVADDLAYYWQHRAGHRVRWFWASHVNHHSSQHYNLSTALRQTWTGMLAFTFVFRLPMVAVGFEPGMVLTCAAFNLIYQFWIHTEAIGRLPNWFEAVFNTPSHHRVHHATNPRYLDRNFAGTFIVWDRMFGTFEAEVSGDSIRYGIVRQLGSFNLLHAAFHEWVAMLRDVARAPWWAKLAYLWCEPGWSHDGSRETSEMIRRRWGGASPGQLGSPRSIP
jgi:sterol desaturase/sphingolipid hydroxylase (fatty acid hydroxylase superfamily)